MDIIILSPPPPSLSLTLSHQLEVPHALYLATEYNISRGSCGKYVRSMTHAGGTCVQYVAEPVLTYIIICFTKVPTELSDLDSK